MPETAHPEAPRVTPDPTIRPSGRVVTPANAADLQARLNDAAPGDRIECDPTRPWVGNWLITRPPEGARVVLTSTRPDVPVRFLTTLPQPVFRTVARAGGVHWLNTEITLDPGVNYSGGQSLVQLGANETGDGYPRSLGFERTRIFGNPGQDVRRGILTNCGDFFFVDGRIEEIHQRGTDSQAICGWNAGPGHLIRDAYLEGASENIMYGGAGNTGAGMNPRDITIERVHLFKPLTLKGGGWAVKNHFELKNAQRVRVRGLRCTNCWGDGQIGRSVVLTPRDTGACPWIVVQDVEMQSVWIEHVNSAFVVLGHDDIAGAPRSEANATSRVRFRNWLVEVEAWGRGFEFAGASYDVELDRLTVVGAVTSTAVIDGTVTRLTHTNTILPCYNYGWMGASGEGDRIAHLFPTPVLWGRVLHVGPSARPIAAAVNPMLPGIVLATPDPATVFADVAARNYRPRPTYAGLGVDQDVLESALLRPAGAPPAVPPAVPPPPPTTEAPPVPPAPAPEPLPLPPPASPSIEERLAALEREQLEVRGLITKILADQDADRLLRIIALEDWKARIKAATS